MGYEFQRLSFEVHKHIDGNIDRTQGSMCCVVRKEASGVAYEVIQ
jgi:hypothetical protein